MAINKVVDMHYIAVLKFSPKSDPSVEMAWVGYMSVPVVFGYVTTISDKVMRKFCNTFKHRVGASLTRIRESEPGESLGEVTAKQAKIYKKYQVSTLDDLESFRLEIVGEGSSYKTSLGDLQTSTMVALGKKGVIVCNQPRGY